MWNRGSIICDGPNKLKPARRDWAGFLAIFSLCGISHGILALWVFDEISVRLLLDVIVIQN